MVKQVKKIERLSIIYDYNAILESPTGGSFSVSKTTNERR